MQKTKPEFKHVAILAHPKIKLAFEEAGHIAGYLQQHGLTTVSGSLADEDLRQRVRGGEFDLVITLGGDGTVLRAGHICAPGDVPILPINLGRFGFLIEVTPGEWQRYLDELLAGNFWYEQRMLLQAELLRKGKSEARWDVLNEVVISRGQVANPVYLTAHLDGRPLTTYVADGLIVATPTGSTAYALAAGGPILPPELRNILLIPVAPHISMDRALVLSEGACVSVEAISGYRAVISVDGQTAVKLKKGDLVSVYANEYSLRFVRFQDAGYFYSRIISLMDQHPSAGVNNK